jgi:hypothetical protein
MKPDPFASDKVYQAWMNQLTAAKDIIKSSLKMSG